MQFGIMEMQLAQLIPPDLAADLAIHQITTFDRGQLVGALIQEGFQCIELGGDLGLFFPNAFSTENIQRLKDLQAESGVTYTLHLPLWSVAPATPLEPVRKGSVTAWVDTLKAVEPLDPEVVVLHATGSLAAEFYRMSLPPLAKSLALKQFQQKAITSIQVLIEKTRFPSRKLAIETIEFPLDLTLEIAEHLDLSICLDTGHVLAGFAGAIPFKDALQTCLPRLVEVHLHDAPDFMQTGELGYGADHQPLGSGDLDTEMLLSTLQTHAFQGPVIFELDLEEAKQSMLAIQQLRRKNDGV